MRQLATTATVTALESNQVKTVGIIVIVAVVLLGVIISSLITKVVIRAVVLLVAVLLGLIVFYQRQHVENAANSAVAHCDVSFFGIHVAPSDPVLKAQCEKLGHK